MSVLHPTALTKDFTVSPQIEPADIPAIIGLGFRTIINNRPDGEVPDQPTNADIERAAKAGGIPYFFHPVIGGLITPEQVAQMAKILAEAPKPVFAFCRSGARCTSLFQMVKEYCGQ